ncbi:MAG TPA: YihY family inner membrane protein [Gallionellaceae bacterium]|nr:YihY family inner membrane protein [Gallionellaceae bacterium]
MKIPVIHLWRFLRFIVARFRQERCAQMASSLTFTTLLSLVPLITIILTLSSAFPQFVEFSTNAKNVLLANMLPETGGRIITNYIQQFADNAARLTAFGIALLAVTAMLLMLTIDNAFNMIWRVSQPRPLLKRVLIYWAVLTLGPLLMGGSLSLTSWLISLSVGHVTQIPPTLLAVLKVVPALLATVAFTLMFRVVPNRYVPLPHALIGGAVAAIAFEAMGRGFALYIAYFPTYKLVYGAFASVPIFLLWVYMSWLSVLLGAVLTASLSHWKSDNGDEPLSQDMRLYYALRILKLMSDGMVTGKVQTLQTLSRELRVGYDALEELLEKMATINLVRHLAGPGWALVRSPEHVEANELYRLFVFDPGKPPVAQEAAGINEWFARLTERCAQSDGVTIHSLFGHAAGKAA